MLHVHFEYCFKNNHEQFWKEFSLLRLDDKKKIFKIKNEFGKTLFQVVEEDKNQQRKYCTILCSWQAYIGKEDRYKELMMDCNEFIWSLIKNNDTENLKQILYEYNKPFRFCNDDWILSIWKNNPGGKWQAYSNSLRELERNGPSVYPSEDMKAIVRQYLGNGTFTFNSFDLGDKKEKIDAKVNFVLLWD